MYVRNSFETGKKHVQTKELEMPADAGHFTSVTSVSEKALEIDWRQRFDAEVDRRRNIQKDLFIEKDRTRRLTAQLEKEKEENCKLHQRIGALEKENELTRKEVSQL